MDISLNRAALQLELNAFYIQAIEDIRPLFDEKQAFELSAPMLISVSDAYLEAPVRVMFVGKETNKWCGTLLDFFSKDNGMDRVLTRYRGHLARKKWKSLFMQTLGRTSKELAGGKPEAILYTNLIKMDWGKGGQGFARNSKNHSEALSKFSKDLFRFEVNLLNPDVIIFASGAPYDTVIKNIFPSEERSASERLESKALWKFNVGNIVCYRARHPGAIAQLGSPFLKTSTYYTRIIADVKANFADRYLAPV